MEMETAIVFLSIAVVMLVILVAINSYEYKTRREIFLGIIVDYVEKEKLGEVAEKLHLGELEIFAQFLGEKKLDKKEE